MIRIFELFSKLKFKFLSALDFSLQSMVDASLINIDALTAEQNTLIGKGMLPIIVG